MVMETVGGRPRVDPDPQVRRAILSAALDIARADGIRALGIAQVLSRVQLGTRAFYRHFDSKDQLVAAMFLEAARAERTRLQQVMGDSDPVHAVAAWIHKRLDLAFDPSTQSDERRLSVEAHSQVFAAPELIMPAYAEILQPLIDQIDRGMRQGTFVNVDPRAEALSIHGIVWARIESHWPAPVSNHSDIRQRVLRFCLRGLGVAPEAITDVLGADSA